MTIVNEEERIALRSLTFNWTSALEGVWRPARYHVEGLHAEATSLIRQGIEEATASTERANPLGLPLQGERGVGKTHLLGWARELVQAAGGYFFLLGDLTRTTFWEEARTAFVQQLLPLKDGSRNQLGGLLADLADQAGMDKPVRDAVTGVVPPSPVDVAAFIAALRSLDPSLLPPCLDTARALVLLASPESGHTEVGYSYLDGGDVDDAERRSWGIRNRPNTARFVINQVSRLLALSGPTVVAVDQIDALIDQVGKDENAGMVAEVATGLMDLRDTTFRTFTIISCLPESWEYVRDTAVGPALDRFRPPCQMQNIPTADIGRHMIAQRFAVDYARAGFRPTYPTWPIRPSAFSDATGYTARSLLKRIDAHVRECLRQDSVTELGHLSDVADGAQAEGEVRPEVDFTALDAQFRELWDTADVSAALVPGSEDGLMPDLLDAGLDSWIRERGEADSLSFIREQHPRKNPALHAELRMITDDRTEAQRRWAFRAIAAENAKSVLGRLRNATQAIGLDSGTANRQLFVLRSTPWPNGPKSEAGRAEFTARGGLTIPATVGDLKTLAALRAMLAGRHPDLNAWLVARQPAHRTDLLRLALADVVPPETPTSQSGDEAGDLEPVPETNRTVRTPLSGEATAGLYAEGSFQVGARIPAGAPVSLDLAVLRMHTVLFAGNGSGKTVLLRRVIEECALRGVSSIVLDPGNDLARLGDAWPEPPGAWSDGDAPRAAEYLAETDVVVWTPRRASGRPLTFRPLPDFAAVKDDAG